MRLVAKPQELASGRGGGGDGSGSCLLSGKGAVQCRLGHATTPVERTIALGAHDAPLGGGRRKRHTETIGHRRVSRAATQVVDANSAILVHGSDSDALDRRCEHERQRDRTVRGHAADEVDSNLDRLVIWQRVHRRLPRGTRHLGGRSDCTAFLTLLVGNLGRLGLRYRDRTVGADAEAADRGVRIGQREPQRCFNVLGDGVVAHREAHLDEGDLL
mmetsp:Transcript_41649/g.100176  ORF Transcript_41649/g.100176 Transcript_41649/m.100176 type:complete len:216 (-) Transcript_41649:156-803(-)